MHVAAIDCGTNSIRLLIAEPDADGGLRDVHREMRIVRLGQGVDATGRLAPEALQRTKTALIDYAAICRDNKVDRVRMVATSATRDAANRDEFFAMTKQVLGTEAQVISGDEEARLSFAGAVAAADPGDGPFLVVDVGGGSTELVLGTVDDTGGVPCEAFGARVSRPGAGVPQNTGAVNVQAARSVDIGCVRLTERCLHSDPPTGAEIAAAKQFAATVLAEAFAAVPVAQARTWIGVAGTVTTLSAVSMGLPEYDAERIHGSTMSTEEIVATQRSLAGMNNAQRGELGAMHPGRVDVINGGAIVVRVLAEQLADQAGIGELLVSEKDILDGIAMSLR